MKLRPCHDPNYVGSVPVLQSIKKFIGEGKIAPFFERRGTYMVQSFITWDTAGQFSYLAGRPAYFPQDADIDKGIIKALQITTAQNQQFNATSPAITDPLTTKLAEGYLVIVDDCKNEIAKIPLSALAKQYNGNKPFFCNYNNIRWEQCYVVFPAAAGISQANSICFNVYLDLK